MDIYTSYFAKERKLREKGIVQISIARFPPKFFYGQNLFELAPRADMLRMPEEQYDIEFKKILAWLNPQQIYEQIKRMSEGRDAALLCFEKSGDPCHRYMVADWLDKKLGLNIKEFDYVPKRAPEATQGSLF
jgi:uncharacterized protein (DUF488 family)